MPELLRKQQVFFWKEQGENGGEGAGGANRGLEAEGQDAGVRQEVCGVNLSTNCNKNQISIQALVLWLKP